MKYGAFCVILMLNSAAPLFGQRLKRPINYQSDYDDDFHEAMGNKEEEIDANSTGKGLYVGAACEFECNSKLINVYCNTVSGKCECQKNYPVKLNPYTGCGKPKRLGDQCYYRETCQYTDQHSSCIQIHHNAICQCEDGYHSVSIQKPSKRIFCAEDLVVMTTDFSTFAGVLSGIAILSGLICFVLRLFNQNLYGPRRHRFGNANLPPPILFSSDPGPLPILDASLKSASRASSRTVASAASSVASRRASSAQGFRANNGGIATISRAGAARTAAILLLSYCHDNLQYADDDDVDGVIKRYAFFKTGSRRPSLASIHSNTSIRSFSARRYEREREQKEEREMQRRMERTQSALGSISAGIKMPATPSPHSTDDLLPTLEEDKQVPPLAIEEESSASFHEDVPSTSKQFP